MQSYEAELKLRVPTKVGVRDPAVHSTPSFPRKPFGSGVCEAALAQSRVASRLGCLFVRTFCVDVEISNSGCGVQEDLHSRLYLPW